MARKSTFPDIGVPVKIGRLILEAGDIWGDELSFAVAGDCDGSGRDDEESLEPDVRALLDRLYGTGEGARGPILV